MDRIEKKLKEQIDLLKSYIAQYDNGNTSYALPIAVALRVILHDTKSSHSILEQLQRKDIEFYDSSMLYEKDNLIKTYMGLTSTLMTPGTFKIIPNIDRFPGIWKTFKGWREGIVLVDEEGNAFSRSGVVDLLANKDGGAHVDSNLNKMSEGVISGSSIGFVYSINGSPFLNIDNIHYATIRQIAHELLKSLIADYSIEINPPEGIITSGIYITQDPPIDYKSTTKRMQCPCGRYGKKYKNCCGKK